MLTDNHERKLKPSPHRLSVDLFRQRRKTNVFIILLQNIINKTSGFLKNTKFLIPDKIMHQSFVTTPPPSSQPPTLSYLNPSPQIRLGIAGDIYWAVTLQLSL